MVLGYKKGGTRKRYRQTDRQTDRVTKIITFVLPSPATSFENENLVNPSSDEMKPLLAGLEVLMNGPV
jgi:hypothetical protein